MNIPAYKGLFIATYTPMDEDGRIRLDVVPDLVDLNIEAGASGLYICGTTGEGMSLTTDERKQLASAFIKAADGRVPVVIQTGHNALPDACDLTAHAAAEGAVGVSAHPPTYYKVEDMESLVECSRIVAASAPSLPFYYYHIPGFTGAHFPMKEFCVEAVNKIPTFGGLKFSDSRVDFLKRAKDATPDNLNFFWGCDEMLFSGLANGIEAAVGSTYNVFGKEFLKVIERFEAGDINGAAEQQLFCTKLIAAVAKYPFHSAMKAILTRMGAPCGPTRLPNKRISESQANSLFQELEELGFEV